MSYEPKTVQVVLARYQESLEWIKDLQSHCVVYDKGDAGDASGIHFDKVVKLINFGRESNSYLAHIIDTYPDFPDYTIFTQGNISDHVRDVEAFKKRITDIALGRIEAPPDYTPLNEFRCNSGCGVVRNWNDSTHSGLPIRETYEMLYDKHPENDSIPVNYCAIFMVSKKAILFHSKRFYETMYDHMATHEPASGYVFERLWRYIMESGLKGRPEIENAPTSPRKIVPQFVERVFDETCVPKPRVYTESDSDNDNDNDSGSDTESDSEGKNDEDKSKDKSNDNVSGGTTVDVRDGVRESVRKGSMILVERCVSNGRYTRVVREWIECEDM